MLPREQLERVELPRAQPLGRPACRATVRIAGFVQDAEDRITGERERRLDIVKERGRVRRQLEEVMEPLGAVAHAQQKPELLEPA